MPLLLTRYRRRHHVKYYRNRDYTIPISRDPRKRRTFTAKIKEGNTIKYIGTFDSMVDCAQAHKAYIRTKIS